MKVGRRISFVFLLSVTLAWGLCLAVSTPTAAQKTMPNVVDMTLDQAKTALAQAGLTDNLISYITSLTNTQSLDQKVYAQDPAAGQVLTGTVTPFRSCYCTI